MTRRVLLILGLLLACSLHVTGQGTFYEQGEAAYQRGDYAKAISLFQQVSTSDPNRMMADIRITQSKDCQALMKKAKSAYSNGDYAAAKKYYRDVLEINEKDPNAKKGVSDCDAALAAQKSDNSSGSGGGGSGGNGNTGSNGGNGGNSGSGGKTDETSASKPISTLSLSSKRIAFAATGETRAVTVTSNTTWKILNLPAWCDAKRSGNNLILSVTENTTGKELNGVVKVQTTDGEANAVISISQPSVAPTLKLSPDIHFPASGGTDYVSVTCNVSWTYQKSAGAFFTVIPNGSSLTVTCPDNSSISSRSGTIYVNTADGSATQSVTVTQNGAEVELAVTPPSPDRWSYSSGSTSFTVRTNASDYTVSCPYWCNIEDKQAGSFKIRRDSNNSTIKRDGTITVTAGGKSQSISVSQAGKPETTTTSSSTSSSSSSGRPRHRRGYTGNGESWFRIGVTANMEICDMLGFGGGLAVRVGRYDSIFNLVSGIHYQAFTGVAYNEAFSGVAYDEWGYDYHEEGPSFALVPVELRLKISNWDQTSDGTWYIAGGTEYNINDDNWNAAFGRLGFQIEHADTHFYLRGGDFAVFGIGFTYYF